jgi:hypothetical protein|tara:strand:- start:2744 stop:3121 length:378 start_codon:yes stop_codon:yes gene_type:complete
MEGPKNGGVGRQLGSNGRKGGDKKKSGKSGPKSKKVNKKAEQKKQMEAVRQLKADKKERQDMDDFLFGPLKKLPGGGVRYKRDAAQGKAATVRNPSGKPRTFQENMAFLTLCCSVYETKTSDLPS